VRLCILANMIAPGTSRPRLPATQSGVVSIEKSTVSFRVAPFIPRGGSTASM